MSEQQSGPWLVAVGGSPQARKRWPSRKYTTKSAARRRLRKIREARDLGVETVWIVPDERQNGSEA